MRFKLLLTFATCILSLSSLFAQEDIQIGGTEYRLNQQTGFFDFSDPDAINIKVQLWGYVRYPGYYVIPARSSVNELISLAGGPLEDAKIEDIRIIRANVDSSTSMFKYNYNAFLWEDELGTIVKFPRLLAGDMIMVPGEPRYFVREDITFFLQIFTALAAITSAAAIIISVTKD
jgi:hypothetical protein